MAERLTTKEAAELLGVHPVTMRKWRQKSKYTGEFEVYEDCQGLLWWPNTVRKFYYDGASVRRLKELLDRRKGK